MTIAAVVIAATTIFAGCKKDKKDEPIVEKIKVTGVSVCPTAVMVTINGSTMLTAEIVPTNADDRSVKWVSDKPSVVSVNESGVVTGHALGEATITCTTNDGGFTFKTTVIVIPVGDDDNYATLVPGFYFGDLTMGEESVGTNKLITVKYDSENKIQLSLDEKFKVPQMGGAEVPMKVDCIADITKVENGYKVEGITTVSLMGFSLPVTIDGTFTYSSGYQWLDMNIVIEMPAQMGGNTVVNFKGTRYYMIDECAISID